MKKPLPEDSPKPVKDAQILLLSCLNQGELFIFICQASVFTSYIRKYIKRSRKKIYIKKHLIDI